MDASIKETNSGLDKVARDLSLRLHAGHTWLIRDDLSLADLLERTQTTGATLYEPLGGSPVACRDLRAACREAHAVHGQGQRPVVTVDNTLPTSFGCAPTMLGADLSYERLGAGAAALSASKPFLKCGGERATRLKAAMDALPKPEARPQDLAAAVVAGQARWHDASDAAQVVAAYLRCHPRVLEVRYPGLKGDPSFDAAARTLSGGFGPLIDMRLEGRDGWLRLVCDQGDPREKIQDLEDLLARPDAQLEN